MTLQTGKRKPVFVGSYRFTGKVLGKGNFARVEEALHGALSCKVAVKVMDLNNIKEEYVIKNLYREAKLMSKLNHPCIAALYQTMQRPDNVYYLVTELITGGDLCTFVKGQKSGKLEEVATRTYGRQFVSALAHMHGRGVVHRDLKMENVMLNAIQTQIKIVDFGLSNEWTPDDPLRTHCGSPEYAAPELFVTGSRYGPEVDLWSLGIIFYGMVIGQLPFATNRDSGLSSQEQRRRLVAQINKGLGSGHRRILAPFSNEFRNILGKLLVADASRRATIKELLVHAWITDRGKKFIKTNPIRQLDSASEDEILTTIATQVGTKKEDLKRVIDDEPLGKYGAMYKILVHKKSLEQLHGDGITRIFPSLSLNVKDIEKDSKHERTVLKVSTVFTPRVILTDKKVHKTASVAARAIPTKESKKPSNAIRPSSVQPVDYRNIQSPSLRRKAYSASITPKTARQASPQPKESLDTPQKRLREVKEVAKILNNTKVDNKGGLSEAFNNIKKLPLVNGVKKMLKPQTRAQTAAEKKSTSKSDHQGMKRPNTGASTVPLRRSSRVFSTGRPATVTASIPARPATESRVQSTQIKPVASPPERLERSPHAHGDGSSSRKPVKPIIYDPIARSIAGYVVNNMPDRFSWIRK